MSEERYVPILKWKSGEKAALENLSQDQRSVISPFIEIVDVDDPGKIVEDLLRTVKGVPIYIDTKYVEEDVTLLTSILIAAKDKNIKIYPVLYYEEFPHLADKVETLTDRILVRIPVPEDIDGGSYENIFSSIVEWLQGKSTKVDIMLDLHFIASRSSASLLFTELKSIINAHVITNEFLNNIIIASTSFPDNLADVAAGEDLYIDRYEMKIFDRIIRTAEFSSIFDRLIYSDYGVTRFTDTEIDFSRMKYGILPKARYTIPEKYWILKGKRDGRTRVLIRNHSSIAKEIKDSRHYYGEGFSFGDLDIKERADGTKGPGNNTNWVAIAANHHIAVVTEELSKLLAP